MAHYSLNVSVFALLGFVFVGCAADTPTTVAIQIEKPAGFAVSSEMRAFAPVDIDITFPGDNTQTIFVSETGLLKSHACYLINVNGPGLTVDNTSKPGDSSCGFSPPGLGKVFGPFPYGVEAKIQVPSGSSRQFDLIGFINPYGVTDPNCQRAFRTHVRADGKVDFFYGDFAIAADPSDASFFPSGITVAPEPSDALFAFASNQGQLITLAPGASTYVTLPAIAWEADGPKEYGCNKGPDISNLTFPYLQEDNDGNRYIRTGMNSEAFLEVQCPQGATNVSLRLTGNAGSRDYDSSEAPSYPPSTCINGRATFMKIPLGSGSLTWKSTSCAAGEAQCVDFEVYSGTVIEGAPFLDGQFLKNDRYNRSMLASGTTQFTFGSTSTFPNLKIVGYRKLGDSRYFTVFQKDAYLEGNSGIYDSQFSDFHFTLPSTTYSNTAPRTLVAASSIISSTLVSRDSTFLDSILVKSVGLFGISGFSNTLIHGLQASSLPSSAIYDGLTTSTQTGLATDNGMIISAPNGSSNLYYNPTPSIASPGTPISIPKSGIVIGDLHIRADLPTGAGAIQHIVYWNPSDPDFGYTRCSGMPSPTPTCVTQSRAHFPSAYPTTLYPVGMDFFVGGPHNRLLVFFKDSSNNYSLRHYDLTGDNPPTSAAIVDVNLDGDGIMLNDPDDVAKFYPPLPADIESGSARLKTLTNTDAGITSQSEAILTFTTTTGPLYNFIYRTRDGGKTWFKVSDLYGTKVLSIHPIHLYEGDGSYKPGFSMLIEEGNQYKLLNQDTFHGF